MKRERRRRSTVIDLTRGERDDVTPPVDRGRLWYDFQIPDRFLGGLPKITNKVRWVREHLPRAKRLKIGNDSAWYEGDVLEWLAAQQQAQDAAEELAS